VSLPRFGVTRPVPVNLLMAAMLAAGAYCAVTLRREFFPEIDPRAATVSMPYPGATPEEIEDTLAIKIEDKLADLDEVDKLRTTISENGGGIVVEFREGIPYVGDAVDEVERSIDALTDLPDDAEKIQTAELEARLPVIMVAIFGDVDEEVLKQTIREIKDDIQTLEGMGEVLISGVRDYEIRVDVDAAVLLEHGISLPHVAETINAWMADVPGGAVRSPLGNAVRYSGSGKHCTWLFPYVENVCSCGSVV
jgi:HAE1 family hydrophobic/amphiphilic exporter-1